jgi:hypothetical protein
LFDLRIYSAHGEHFGCAQYMLVEPYERGAVKGSAHALPFGCAQGERTGAGLRIPKEPLIKS